MRLQKITKALAIFGVVALTSGICLPALANEGVEIPRLHWQHKGMLGTYDKAALQRGFQVYKEVCSACHSMKLLSYRNLTALGYSEAQVKALAAEYTVTDGPNDQGDMFERPARPADRFKSSFANDQAARAANNGALPPDFSLIVKARAGGEDYIHALLTGFGEAPAGVEMMAGMNWNKYFTGHQIAMAPPLSEGQVSYADGTVSSVDQMARDVSTFLAWASEPHLEQSNHLGLKVMIFLAAFCFVMYRVKRKVWSDVH